MMKAPSFCTRCLVATGNGIGPADIPILTKFLQIFPSSHLFKNAANWHDYLYHLGLNEADRKKADDTFLYFMRLAVKNECSWYLKPWYTLQAYRNFWFVKKFGKRYFNYAGCNGN